MTLGSNKKIASDQNTIQGALDRRATQANSLISGRTIPVVTTQILDTFRSHQLISPVPASSTQGLTPFAVVTLGHKFGGELSEMSKALVLAESGTTGL